jgi:putative membrane protein
LLYLTAKAVHIVGFISWFAGLFYLVRLFVYHAEAAGKPEPERSILQRQLEAMQARLWKIITLPAMVLTFLGGVTMAVMIWPGEPWLHHKFVWLALLVAYNFACGRIRTQQAGGTSKWTSARLRIFNEVATLLMAAIVFLAVFRSSMSAIWGALGLLGLGIALMVGIRVYRRIRAASEASAA